MKRCLMTSQILLMKKDGLDVQDMIVEYDVRRRPNYTQWQVMLTLLWFVNRDTGSDSL